ncbi:MAG: uroporphyrinogen-III synthase, partial [Planctomycetota bacterium]
TFSSPNSVAVFWRYVLQHGYDARLAAGCKIAVVGPGTADALREFGLRADFMPDAEQGYSASGLLQHLQSLRPPVRRWLVTASNESRDTLVQGLQAAGWEAERVETYRAVANDQLAPDVAAALEAGQIQFCTVTSAAIARASFAMLQGHTDRVRPISFSPAVSEQLRALGWPPVEEAGQQTIPELIASIVRAVVD